MPAYLVAYDIVDNRTVGDKLGAHLETMLQAKFVLPGVYVAHLPANAAVEVTADLIEVVGEEFAFVVVQIGDYDLQDVQDESYVRSFIDNPP